MHINTESSLDISSRRMSGEFDICYRESGSGRPLLLLHGSGPGVSGWSNFGENIPVFARSFRTLCPDMPGFGDSPAVPWRDAYSRIAADAMRWFLDRLEIDVVDVVGNSMGGNVGAELALVAPDRVRRLVLMGPGGLAVSAVSPPVSEGARRLFEFLRDPTRPRMAAWIDTMVSDPAMITDELLDERMSNALRGDAIDRTAAIFATFDDPELDVLPPLWTRARALTTPTLIVWGRDDRMLPFESGV